MLYRVSFLFLVALMAGCVSTRATPTSTPPATLPIATGIPVTPRPTVPKPTAEPTATVETLPTPDNAAELFAPAVKLLKSYQPPDADPKALYDALAKASGDFLAATANGDVSLQDQPALGQLADALTHLPNLPDKAQAKVTAIHIGDDQGGSRDLVFIAMENVMGLPIIAMERLGGTYDSLPPVLFNPVTSADDRYFYPSGLDAQDVTGDDQRELIYEYEYPGGSGTTDGLTIARYLLDKQELHTIFHTDLINWAGESDYQIEQAADAVSIKLTFPWFGAFDHKLLEHLTATQTWVYDDKQDKFVRVSQTIQDPKTPREALNAGEYAFRNGDLNAALALYNQAWKDTTLVKEDFAESKADPIAFAKFREAMLLNLMGRADEAKPLLTDAQKSGDALTQVANTYGKNSSGKEGALRGWIAMANGGDLYDLIYESKAGNLDFPFDAREIYVQGGIVSTYLNTHGDADKNPDQLWSALEGLGFKPLQRASADLNGDGVNEFFVVTKEGGTSPNQSQSLWFIYKIDKTWRVRALDIADTVQFEGDAVALPAGKNKALKLKLPDAFTPNETALTWDGSHIIWLDAKTLQPTQDNWTSVGGGVLEDDF